ncbi:MAG: DUF2953 domain-containing protein [Clostridia bacterium]|nr:DUF2953 domain-containing protein [Clostridia bacterium]
MKVFLIILAVLAGIAVLIALLFSIKVAIRFDYDDKVRVRVKWLFINLQILPAAEKEKKSKKQKKPAQETPEEPKKEEEAKQKKANPFKTFYDNKGVEGIYELLYKLCQALNGFFGKIIHRIRLDEFFVYITVGSGDAAKSALDYGRISGAVFPMLGYICSHMSVGKYDAEITPDFLAEKTTGELHATVSFRPIRLTNAGVSLVFRLLFSVALKFLKGLKAPKAAKQAATVPAVAAEVQSNH